MLDNISGIILKIIKQAGEPLETKEIQKKVEDSIKNVTRTKIFYRLTNLRGEGLIKGKFVGPGKGVWIWWTPTAFVTNDKRGKK